LVHPDTLALAKDAVLVHVGKRSGRHSTAQHFINKRLIDAARAGHMVVRLKGGDPMIFGRSQEELDALTAAGIHAEVVPGVTAALAAAAELRTSLTRRGSSRSVAFATPSVGESEGESDWARTLASADSAAIYMGAKRATAVKARLLSLGRHAQTPIVVCESVSLPNARSVSGTLSELPDLAAQLGDGPKLILVGDVFAQAGRSRQTPENGANARAAA
jgi:uroporphyrin-III C-methyltransferase